MIEGGPMTTLYIIACIIPFIAAVLDSIYGGSTWY